MFKAKVEEHREQVTALQQQVHVLQASQSRAQAAPRPPAPTSPPSHHKKQKSLLLAPVEVDYGLKWNLPGPPGRVLEKKIVQEDFFLD